MEVGKCLLFQFGFRGDFCDYFREDLKSIELSPSVLKWLKDPVQEWTKGLFLGSVNMKLNITLSCLQQEQRMQLFHLILIGPEKELYRDGLKGGSQVLWIWGENIVFPCPQQTGERNIFTSYLKNLGSTFRPSLYMLLCPHPTL